jgi:hypothetical protein
MPSGDRRLSRLESYATLFNENQIRILLRCGNCGRSYRVEPTDIKKSESWCTQCNDTHGTIYVHKECECGLTCEYTIVCWT